MISYLILLLIVLALLFLTWKMFKKDLLSPSFISVLCYLAAISLAIIGLHSWNDITSLHLPVITLITVALLSFILGEFFARKLPFFTHRQPISSKKSLRLLIRHSAPRWLCVVTILLALLSSASILRDLKKICNYYSDECSATSLPSLINFYRTKSDLFTTASVTSTKTDSTNSTSENQDDTNSQLPPTLSTLSNQSLKLCNVLAIFFVYFLVTAIYTEPNRARHFYHKLLRRSLSDSPSKLHPLRSLCRYLKASRKPLYALIVSLTMAPSILTSRRSTLFHVVVAGVFIYLFLFMKTSPKKSDFTRLARNLALSVAVILIGFYGAGALVGRSASRNIFDYVSFYFGVSIPSFESYLSGHATELPNYLKPNFACEYSAYKSAYDQAYKLLAPEIYQDSYDNPPAKVYEKLNSEIISYIESDELKDLIIKNAKDNSEKTGTPVDYEKINADYKTISEKVETCYKTAAKKVALVSSETKKSDLFGGETFRGVYETLARYHLTNTKTVTSAEWVLIGSSSNVYTSIRPLFADFGIFGVIILMFIFGFIFSFCYMFIHTRNSLLAILIFSNYYYTLIDQIRDNFFYYNFNTSTLSYILIFIILYVLIIKLPEKRIHVSGKKLLISPNEHSSKSQDS